MFLGQCFAGTSDSFSSTTIVPNDIETLTLENAVFDEVYVSTDEVDLDSFDGSIPKEWTFNTRLHALFNDTLYGGNVDFTESVVDTVRIKRRTSNNIKFQTIYEKPINSNEDLAITFLDYIEPTGTIEYAYVPVLSNSENDYIVNRVKSNFDYYFLCEEDISYPLILDVSMSEEFNYETSTIRTFGKKYPIVVVRGETGYWSGDIECRFIEFKDCELDSIHIKEYTDTIYKFLTNKKPKILKDYSGNLRMIAITGNISKNEIQFVYDRNQGIITFTTKFSWVEIGDGYDASDLYDNGFIDTDVDV